MDIKNVIKNPAFDKAIREVKSKNKNRFLEKIKTIGFKFTK